MQLRTISDLSTYLHDQARALASRSPGAVFVAAVAGGVAAGKSTFASQLAEAMRNWAPRTEIVSTDGFLFNNAVLAERQISMKKGFPESYDFDALREAVARLKRGERVALPRYSHVTYDVDASDPHIVDRPDAIILDGLHLGRINEGGNTRLVDALIYLDAEESAIEQWFTDRLLPLMVSGRDDQKSFYYAFRDMDDDARRAFTKRVWEGINLPNLREHISQDRTRADVVVTKAADHSVAAFETSSPSSRTN
jgi:type I pantothenate kinase